jgi:hypothetical protein
LIAMGWLWLYPGANGRAPATIGGHALIRATMSFRGLAIHGR